VLLYFKHLFVSWNNIRPEEGEYMIFCGQCGLQLASGTIHCPRCGATVEESKAPDDVSHANDHTIAGQSLPNLSQAGPVMPGTAPQQPLILRPGTTNDYNPEDATSMMEAPTYNTNMPPRQNMGTQYPGGGQYPPQASYPNYSMPGGTYAPAGGMPSPSMTSQMGYAPQQNTGAGSGNPTLRVAGLIIALFGVLLMLSAVILFVMQQNGTL
jgi:hypothetical protein